MKAVGVIVEYNPFHNGHAFHLNKSKEISNCDIVIAVMSGNFLQRGEPALVSKWARTQMALSAGVDLVFELPYSFATQKADTFASGAVSILSAAGCDALCFGSESGNIDHFIHTYHFLNQNDDAYQFILKKNLAKGMSYPSAASKAFLELAPQEQMIDLSKPNNILGYHYVKAVLDQKLNLNIHTVSRKNANYHDENFSSGTIASATSIRKALFSEDGNFSLIKQYIPESTYELLVQYADSIGSFHHWENYWPYLQSRFLQLTAHELSQIYEVEEGLENRILSIGIRSTSFSEFMTNLKTKRYTWTRLQRMCVHILTNTKKEEMRVHGNQASYLRLLGMTRKGREYLNKNKETLRLPLISKLSAYSKEDITLDIKASRIYALGAPDSAKQDLINMDFTQPPIQYK